jgi:hypothetical protein
VAQEKLEAHGYAGFTLDEGRFAGMPGAMLEFVTRNSTGMTPARRVVTIRLSPRGGATSRPGLPVTR